MSSELEVRKAQNDILSTLGVGKTPLGCYLALTAKNSLWLDKPEGEHLKPGMFNARTNIDNKVVIYRLGKFEKDSDGRNKGMVNCFVGPWRPHAVHFKDNKAVEKSYNMQDEIFQRIKNTADSKVKIDGEGFKYGLEVLLYIPPDEIFAPDGSHPEAYKDGMVGAFFFGGTATKSALAGEYFPPFESAVTLKSVLVTWNNMSWWNPQENVKIPSTSEYFQKYHEVAKRMLLDKSEAFIRAVNDTEFVDPPLTTEVDR